MQIGSQTQQAPFAIGTGGSIPGARKPGRKTGHSSVIAYISCQQKDCEELHVTAQYGVEWRKRTTLVSLQEI